MKRFFKIALLVVVLLGIVRIAWSFVETGQFPNPVDDLTAAVSVIQDWMGSTFSTGSVAYGQLP